ncbi:glycosyl transferase [Pectobacterium carotovorum subsp. carotovorum]|uniref:glycosyltransferase family 2 protein n=1 Tax=Pectobacterium brasiliense TaxID=180957 RepID=UPI00207E25DE|nr:glycosyltransferase [Pectobacterium brasiliense]MDY4335048.1 glycosyltransferase [Pectobacterium brasiliense]GKV76992.1 glycosyl transferase [Pectobacterium carotovorum subsp. carotovorum]
MMLPKISILIPCYNHERYVITCIESIFHAYSGRLEVIICDDKSKDQSISKIESFLSCNSSKNVNFVFLRNNINQGISATLNKCLSHSSSDYVYIIASDDYLVKDGLTKSMAFLLEKNCDAVINDCFVVDEENKIVASSAFFKYRKSSQKRLHKSIKNELVFNWVVPGPALLIKKRVYDDIGGYDENLIAEDRDFYLRLLQKKIVYFNNNQVACYRIHTTNFSKSSKYKKKATDEFASVNYKHYRSYDNITKLYLWTYWMDKKKLSFFSSFVRRTIKFIYGVFY